MKMTFENLQILESRICEYACKPHHTNWIETSIGNGLFFSWKRMIKKLRGWVDSPDEGQTKSKWIDHCIANNIYENYKFNDLSI